jgi:hypothetical protein
LQEDEEGNWELIGKGHGISFEMFSTAGNALDNEDYVFTTTEPFPIVTFDGGGYVINYDSENKETGDKNYYIVADYDESNNYTELILINIKNNDISYIDLMYKVSYNSYFQGDVDGNVYLFDKDNLCQYQINMSDKNANKSGSEEDEILNYTLVDGEYVQERIPAETAKNSKIIFNTKFETTTSSKYARIDIYKEITYMYKKQNNEYLVYKQNEGSDNLTYLLTTSEISRIDYASEYLYFVENDTLYVYSDYSGVRKIAEYDELEFNQDINFYVYY